MKLRYIFFGIALLFPLFAFASQTNGTIDTAHEFAWSGLFGWVNLGTTGGDVHITDTGITGYAWSANDGWINFAPSSGGVKNDGNGNLSGYAWSEDAGWINFSGVTIDSSGEFTGSTTGSDSSTINFDCSECSVITDWRPASVRGSSGSGGGGSSGGAITIVSGGASLESSSIISPVIPHASSCVAADFNCDGRVNLIDLSILLAHYGQSGPSLAPYEMDHHSSVDFGDISILMYYWTG